MNYFFDRELIPESCANAQLVVRSFYGNCEDESANTSPRVNVSRTFSSIRMSESDISGEQSIKRPNIESRISSESASDSPSVPVSSDTSKGTKWFKALTGQSQEITLKTVRSWLWDTDTASTQPRRVN
jgi:hypothetical protein